MLGDLTVETSYRGRKKGRDGIRLLVRDKSDVCGRRVGKWEIGQGETVDLTVLGQECAHQSHSVE